MFYMKSPHDAKSGFPIDFAMANTLGLSEPAASKIANPALKTRMAMQIIFAIAAIDNNLLK